MWYHRQVVLIRCQRWKTWRFPPSTTSGAMWGPPAGRSQGGLPEAAWEAEDGGRLQGAEPEKGADRRTTIFCGTISTKKTTGWWFWTFVNFPYIGNNHRNWLIFFRGVETTNQEIMGRKKMADFTKFRRYLGDLMNWKGCIYILYGSIDMLMVWVMR